MGGKEIPAVDLSPADIVTNELLLDAACLHEIGRVMHHGHDRANGLIVRQIARLGQNHHSGRDAPRLVGFGDLVPLTANKDWKSYAATGKGLASSI